MIVDIHTQIWDSPSQLGPDAVQRLRRVARGAWDHPDASLKAFEDAIDTVDYAVILGFECRAQNASISHEQIAARVKRHAGRCLGFAGIDPLASDYMRSLEHAVSLGLVGVTVSPAVAAFHPTHSRAMRLYERCQELELPVLFHPGTHFGVVSHLEFSRPFLLDEVARTFPNLRIVIAQVGHPWTPQTLLLLSKHEHVYADLSLMTQRPWELYNILLAAYQQGAIDRLLLGSDFPFLTPKQAILNIYSVNTFTQGTPLPPVPREQLRGIVERDTLACLGIHASAPPPRPSKSLPHHETRESNAGELIENPPRSTTPPSYTTDHSSTSTTSALSPASPAPAPETSTTSDSAPDDEQVPTPDHDPSPSAGQVTRSDDNSSSPSHLDDASPTPPDGLRENAPPNAGPIENEEDLTQGQPTLDAQTGPGDEISSTTPPTTMTDAHESSDAPSAQSPALQADDDLSPMRDAQQPTSSTEQSSHPSHGEPSPDTDTCGQPSAEPAESSSTDRKIDDESPHDTRNAPVDSSRNTDQLPVESGSFDVLSSPSTDDKPWNAS